MITKKSALETAKENAKFTTTMEGTVAKQKVEKKPAKAKAEAKKPTNMKAAPNGEKKPAIPRTPSVADTAIIKLLVKDNPKRGASAERFAKYRTGMTVADALKAGVRRDDLKWDSDPKRNFIQIVAK